LPGILLREREYQNPVELCGDVVDTAGDGQVYHLCSGGVADIEGGGFVSVEFPDAGRANDGVRFPIMFGEDLDVPAGK
jgi:hypothetical protein